MAINAAQVTNLGTIEQLRNQFNNLVTDVTALEAGKLNFAQVSATSISVGDLTVTGAFALDTISPSTFTLNSDRFTVEGAIDNEFETIVVFTEPTADRTITFKDSDGIVAFTTDLGFTNSTLTVLPGSVGATDLAQGETPFDAGATDAFGIAIGSVYDMNEPKGLTSTTDIGSNTGI